MTNKLGNIVVIPTWDADSRVEKVRDIIEERQIGNKLL